MIRLYGDGWSCQRLAERYGCDDETVRQSLKRLGVRRRKPWERYEQSLSQRPEIA